MSDSTILLQARRSELVLRPFGHRGDHVVRDPRTGEYFKLSPEGHFLLTRLDGKETAEGIRSAFEESFGEPLSEEDLEAFLALAETRGFLERVVPPELGEERGEPCQAQTRPSRTQGVPPRRQSLLAWRCRFFDPNRLFTWLEPRLWCFWTSEFLVFSGGCILVAAGLVWLNRQELFSSIAVGLNWETALAVWLTLVAVTACHESAHGLTCKHYGGEVHEVGFLLLLLMPCFYCNVSDAWLFREKSKRLWVTLAGGYFELFLWSLAVFVWRLALPGGLLHHVAWVVVTVCGTRVFFNFNPLVKLDGYYLLSDLVEIANLQQSGWGFAKAWLRCLLWGGPRPAPVPRGRFLLGYGSSSLLFSSAFVVLMVAGIPRALVGPWWLLGVLGSGLLGFLFLRGLLRGIFLGEVRKMILTRPKRTAAWLVLLGGAAAALYLIDLEERAGGSFQVRPVTRADLRAPVAGFLKDIQVDGGDRVTAGTPIARLEIPELASRLAQTRAEECEAQAKLSLLEAGPRYEELLEQRQRVERMKAWRDLAKKDLTHAQQALQEELTRLDQQIAQNRAELDAAQDSFERSKGLRSKSVVAEEEFREAERRFHVTKTLLAQAQSQKRHREALGTREAIAGLDAEAELARREKDLADAQSTLTLLEAGTRPEEIEGARARVARLQEEARYLEGLQKKLLISSHVAGIVTTPRLKEKIGQYLHEGEVICQVEEPALLEAEITVAEQEVAHIRLGQLVELKARALPFDTLSATVERIAPAAAYADVQASVTIYCRIQSPPAGLCSGMTGYARIYGSKRTLGAFLTERALRYIRTEFWW